MFGSAVVLAAGLSVSACGVKSSPAHPPGTEFPHQYPTPGPATKIGTASPQKGDAREDTGTGGARSPLGFPLEYPNRPNYK
ncbi:MAG: hypothetical protein ISR51_05260 [Rhodospirillales bacterium]|nr:hypothetical protein [Alphaproteobacteria bacterium]MBL6948067.1 hypothetical protein [Rhodospirillales bacterium]